MKLEAQMAKSSIYLCSMLASYRLRFPPSASWSTLPSPSLVLRCRRRSSICWLLRTRSRSAPAERHESRCHGNFHRECQRALPVKMCATLCHAFLLKQPCTSAYSEYSALLCVGDPRAGASDSTSLCLHSRQPGLWSSCKCQPSAPVHVDVESFFTLIESDRMRAVRTTPA